jgi:uncharacterized membrane protein
MNLRLLINLGLLTLTVLYPVGVYYGIQYLEPRYLILTLFVLFVLRFILNTESTSSNKNQQVILLIVIALFAVAVFISNSLLGLRFYPVLVNAVMLAVFSYTLFNPPSMIERLARLKQPDLPAAAIPYTRKVTITWCLFFMANGSIAAFTAFYSSMEIWSLYNGFIAYLLMGSVFIIEYFIRIRVRRQHQ